MVENTKKLEPLIIIDVRTDWNCNINWGSNMDRVAIWDHVSNLSVNFLGSVVTVVHHLSVIMLFTTAPAGG